MKGKKSPLDLLPIPGSKHPLPLGSGVGSPTPLWAGQQRYPTLGSMAFLFWDPLNAAPSWSHQMASLKSMPSTKGQLGWRGLTALYRTLWISLTSWAGRMIRPGLLLYSSLMGRNYQQFLWGTERSLYPVKSDRPVSCGTRSYSWTLCLRNSNLHGLIHFHIRSMCLQPMSGQNQTEDSTAGPPCVLLAFQKKVMAIWNQPEKLWHWWTPLSGSSLPHRIS